MGRKAPLAVVWLISAWTVAALATAKHVKDNVGKGSARLYRNVPQGVYASAYASAAPYGAFSFHVPSVVPAAKATQLIPVKQESIVIQNSNGFLKDSYGNKFVETPQSVAYKTTFPQQFVQLQHLPLHLAQPLAAAPAFHLSQGPAQPFFGAQYRAPALGAAASPLSRYGTFAQPFAYGAVKNLTPASDQQFQFVNPFKAQQDSSNNKPIYAEGNQFQNQPKFQRLEEKPQSSERYSSSNKPVYAQSYNQLQNEPKYQRSEEKPQSRENYEAPRQQAAPSLKAKVQAPIKHTVKTTHNGQDTVVHIETKPPLPLLDLSLLEPLTFDNPIVPQVQHYLPKITPETYSALQTPDDGEVNHHKEFVVQKTKSYDSGVIKGKAHSDEPKKKQRKHPNKDADVYINFESKSEKPNIKVKGKPNDPGYSYEINSPGHKESFNQQVVSYNKETQNEPITYTYEKQTQKDPVTYSYSHSSKDPGQTKKVQYVKKDPAVKNLVFNFQAEQEPKHDESPEDASEESNDSNESSEADDEGPAPAHYDAQPHHDKPSQSHSTSQSHSSTPSSPTHSQQYIPSHTNDSPPSTHFDQSPHPHPPSTSYPATHSYPSQPEHQKVEQVSHNPAPSFYMVNHTPQFYTPSALTAGPKFPTLQEYMENIRFIPSFPSPLTHASIRVDPNPQPNQQQRPPQLFMQQTTPRARSEGAVVSEPVIYEKSKKIIIQEESPDEMHSQREQEKISAQMVGQGGGNSEEDFEKSYKEAAYGFPAYDRDTAGNAEDIYNHNYGEPHADHSGEDSGRARSPFEQYQEEGDEFPKSARLSYKDNRDKTHEDYFLGYSLTKPEIMTDRHQSKINYYKMFLKNKPEKLRVSDNKKQLSKYSVEPSFFDFEKPKQKSKQSAQYKSAPYKSASYKSAPTYEYNYEKESRDNSAHASRPLRYRSKTHFVEPQFQYGFEPIAIPRLDSELDAMASNQRPDAEKPGTRKKLYKENWYIKKTSTSSKPS